MASDKKIISAGEKEVNADSSPLIVGRIEFEQNLIASNVCIEIIVN